VILVKYTYLRNAFLKFAYAILIPISHLLEITLHRRFFVNFLSYRFEDSKVTNLKYSLPGIIAKT
jgi:hypothetical protein